MTFEELNVENVLSNQLNILVSQVKQGYLHMRQPRSPEYILVQNKTFFQKKMNEAIKASRKEIAKNW